MFDCLHSPVFESFPTPVINFPNADWQKNEVLLTKSFTNSLFSQSFHFILPKNIVFLNCFHFLFQFFSLFQTIWKILFLSQTTLFVMINNRIFLMLFHANSGRVLVGTPRSQLFTYEGLFKKNQHCSAIRYWKAEHEKCFWNLLVSVFKLIVLPTSKLEFQHQNSMDNSLIEEDYSIEKSWNLISASESW